jgi:hypothetical protein
MELKLNLNLQTWIMECSIGDDISIRDRQTREILLVVCGGGAEKSENSIPSEFLSRAIPPHYHTSLCFLTGPTQIELQFH